MTVRRTLMLAVVVAAFAAPEAAPSRASVAVMTLKNAAGVSPEDAELLSDRLRIELFNTGMFSVMERSQMQEILKEQGFQLSGSCTDEGCMVEMGQILGVNQLIGGSIGRLGTMYLINLRCIDIKTAQIVAVVSEDIPGSIEKVVKVFPVIAARLAGVKEPVIASPPPPKESASDESDRQEQIAMSAPPKVGPTEEPAEMLECDEKVYLEKTAWTAADLRFSLDAQKMSELNDEVTDEIEEGFDHCLYDDVEIATREQLAHMPPCNALVIRCVLDSYTTEDGSRGQIKGTATVSFYFYQGTTAQQPFQQVQMSETGSQHWGEYEPFQNAFEEINDEIQDQDFNSYMKELRKYIRTL
ncbi:MAG: hypothetical protein GF331_13455 [Chitinivibrionales bacterium]|nr:hypothetical protein [Chitinivibrionales bacterium]